jgi:UDP-N-acetylglucosamine--N-acetylmuramyl-(pentapeptide) pyrophosphoryl-undecaprenol N-acetylglucosamine transferase
LPAVLLPYPHAAADHQRKNADVFTAAGAARTLDERDGASRLDHRLADMVAELATADRLRVRMADAMTRLARPNATPRVAALVAAVLADRRLARA